jgi:C1A family cysteine protease
MSQKTITAIIALTAMLTGAAVYMNASQPQEISPEVVVQFNTWLQTQHRLYGSPNEMKQRLLNFKQTLDRITEINKSNRGYTAGLNQFSDLTQEEFAAKYLMKIDPTQHLVSKKKTTV